MAEALLGDEAMMNNLDFNQAEGQKNHIHEKLNSEKIKADLLFRIEDVLFYLLPNGYVRNNCFYIGSVRGEAGKSLSVQLSGEMRGVWHDFATNKGGDIFSLWEEVRGYNKSDFNKLLAQISEWLGDSTNFQNTQSKSEQAKQHRNFNDDLGKPTAKWDYLDQDRKLIACVYRYDTEDGKEFRVWDVKNKKAKSPDPRPLYNIPSIINSKKIILVEGEKSADSLISYGFTATTAMFGASAPINKTDWSPLIGKEIIIWPDNDEAGLEYAKKVAVHLLKIASFVSILTPPKDKKEKWDAADAVLENFNIHSFLETSQSVDSKLPSYSIAEFIKDTSPMPEDLITPRLLTPGGMLLIGGAPKVGKSDFLINFLIHMAAGESFLGLKPPRPLRIFYLQAEIGYHYMRERIKKLSISEATIFKASQNLVATSRVQMVLNDQGVEASYRTIKHYFPDQPPDIICIDPIRNIFDGGGENGSENDNNAMLFFLQNRIEKLRSMINPEMGIILCHHTKKIKKKEVEEDPFQAFSGAGSLRSFYSSGLILHRPDELDSRINLYFELRNGSAIPRKIVEKVDNKWTELNPFSERLIKQDYGEKLDSERLRKSDIVLQLIFEESQKGNLYTINQFAEKFENQAGLGGTKTINDRISVLATKGYIKFIRNVSHLGYKEYRSKYGLMCVQDMEFVDHLGNKHLILPTHFKCSNTGVVLPVENSNIWVIHEEVSL